MVIPVALRRSAARGAQQMRACAACITLFLALFTPGAYAAQQWLEDVRYVEHGGLAGVELVFTENVYYRSHFPQGGADALTVHLRVPRLNNYEELPIHEEIKARAGMAVPLARVVFEANEFEAVLRLKLTQPAGYRVSQGSSNKTIIVMFTQAATSPPPVTVPALIPEGERIAALLTQSRDALTRGEVDQAIRIVDALLGLPANPYRADVLELAGVARERKGQRAHAKAAFDKYLAEFPKGEGADRVRQRLAELLSADLKPQEKLKELKPAALPASAWLHNGSVAQYYDRSENDSSGGKEVDQSTLFTQFAWNSQLRGERFDSRIVANLNHTRDFLDAAEDPEINSLFGQMKDKQAGWFAKLGRQSSPGGGVLGRFDGLFAQYDVMSRLQLDVVAGYPVEFDGKDTVQTQHPFWSVAAHLGPYYDYLEVMPYYLRQNAEGLLDREAVGYELSFFHPRGNLYNMVDYDLFYKTLNIMSLRGQYAFLENSSVYGSYEARRTPLTVATSNALSGATGADSLKDLLAQFTRDEIRELAIKRTGDSTTATLGMSHSYSPVLQISGDVTVSKQTFPVEPVDLGVPRATENTQQIYYALQAVRSQLITTRDTLLAGLNHTQAGSYDSSSLLLAHRLPVGQAWRFDTRLRFDRRKSDTGEKLHKTLPKIHIEYRPAKSVETQLELGNESWNYSGTTANPSYTRWLINLGYRWLF